MKLLSAICATSAAAAAAFPGRGSFRPQHGGAHVQEGGEKVKVDFYGEAL